MTRFYVGSKDVEHRCDPVATFDSLTTGADQLIAKNLAAVAWLGKVYGEMQQKSRTWPIFNEQRLGQFLFQAGFNTKAATEAHEDPIPPPPCLADVGGCLETLRGASFLAVPDQQACTFLKSLIDRSPHRRQPSAL